MHQSSQKLHLTVDSRIIIGLLLAVIVGMLLVWRPWADGKQSDRTVEVTGETTITAKPDEYVFMPSYQFANEHKETALAELSAKNDAVVAELKKLGLAPSQIRNTANGQQSYAYGPDKQDTPTYILSLEVTATEKQAQKVQDYLLTTSPVGSVTPQYQLSDKKQDELNDKARDAAIRDARNKAERMADELSFEIGKIKKVSDDAGFGVQPFAVRDLPATVTEQDSTNLTLQPGENDVHYSVTVVYFIR